MYPINRSLTIFIVLKRCHFASLHLPSHLTIIISLHFKWFNENFQMIRLIRITILLLTSLVIIKESSSTFVELTQCSMDIINRYYTNRTYIIYKSLLLVEDIITLTTNQSLPLTIINIENNLEVLNSFKYKHDFHIFVISNVEEFETFMTFAYRTRGWNPRAKIFIIFLGDIREMDSFFKISWKYYSVNVSVLTVNLNVYTYYPLTKNNCGENLQGTLLGNCKKTVDVFPKKLGMYFYGCPIKVLPLVIEPYIFNINRDVNPGYEMMVLRTICQHLNLTIRHVPNPFKHWGTKLSNGTYTDMYKLMWEMKAEIMIGMILANESYADDFDDTFPHTEVDLTFSVPTPLIVEGWKNFIIIFKAELWYSFGVAMLSCILTFWLIGNNQENSEGFNKFGNCTFKVWCVIFSSFSTQPKNSLIRFIYMVWTIYSFLMTCTYSSVLISYLTSPTYEKEIATIKDMVNSNLKYGGLYVIRYIFNEPDNPTYLTLYKQFINCPLAMECTNRTAFKRDFGVIKNARQVAYFTPLLYTYPNGRPRLRRVKDNVVPQCIWTNTIKGFLYVERFNQIVLKLRESGLIFKWDNEATNHWKRSIEIPPSVIPLNITHLKFGFFCLLFGLFTATLTFAIEICVFMKNKFKSYVR